MKSILDRAERLKVIYGKSHKFVGQQLKPFQRYAKKAGGGSRGVKRRNSIVGYKKCMIVKYTQQLIDRPKNLTERFELIFGKSHTLVSQQLKRFLGVKISKIKFADETQEAVQMNFGNYEALMDSP